MALNIDAQFNELRMMITRDGDSVYRTSLQEMDDKADEIVFHAKANAPVDKYNLENAIYRTNAREKGGTRKIRDEATGRFLPYKITIGVKDTIRDQETGKVVNVKNYAALMENSDRAGYGSANNDIKRAAGGHPGSHYMERAYNAVEPTIVPAMIARVRRAL